MGAARSRGQARTGWRWVVCEIGLLALVFTAGYTVAARFDLHETWDSITRRHEGLQLDEVQIGVAAVALTMTIYLILHTRARGRHLARLAASEAELAETSERYRSLFDQHPQRVFSVDREGRIGAMNAAAAELSGAAEADVVGRHLLEFFDETDRARVDEAFAAVLAGGTRQLAVTATGARGNRVDLFMTVLPIVVHDEVVGAFGISEDVTERNRVATELVDARAAAERSDQAKSALLANVSHEFRTPLASLAAATELIADETPLDGVQTRLVAAMSTAVQRLTRLVDNLLDFAEVEAGRRRPGRRPFDPAGVTAALVAAAEERTDPDRVAVEWAVGPQVPSRVVGDAAGVRRVLAQLMDNAVKFTDSGRIRLSVDRVSIEPDADALLFVVADTGIGVRAGDERAIFEPFIQADGALSASPDGVGVGLALAQGLASGMGARLWCEREPRGGTTFSFLLPLGQWHAARSEPTNQPGRELAAASSGVA